MPTVTATLKMFDAMSKPLQQITNSMNLVIRAMEDMQRSANRNVKIDGTLIAAKKQLAVAESTISKSIEDAKRAQDRFNQSTRNSQKSVESLESSVKKMANSLAAAYLTAQGLSTAIQTADLFISTQARMDLIVDEGQSVGELQDMIYAASQRARGDFIAMSDNVARLGLLAGEAFESTAELVAFTEIMQKAFKISGASTMEQVSAMYQLSQAMAAGRLQGDEFRSIMENAPMLADAIAKFTGRSKGELKEMSAEGTITADIIKGALFAAADDINAKFEQLPRTFGEVFQSFQNQVFRDFEPVFQQMNAWLNSAQGQAVIEAVIMAIYAAAQAANALLDVLIWIGDVIYNNWAVIEPILVVLGSVLLAGIISALWSMVSALGSVAVAWLAANWPILLIGAAIGLLIYIFYKWGDVTAEVVGFVGGLIGALVAFFYNSFAYAANIFLSVAEFFANVFRDPVYAVKKLFYDLVINVLEYMENLAQGIENILNKIPGIQVDITSGLDNILNRLETARDNLTSTADVVQLMRFEQQDYGAAFDRGRELGRTASNYISDGIQSAFDKVGGMFDSQNMDKMLAGVAGLGKGIDAIATNGIGKVGKVGRIEDTVDISSEDLKLMRELAEIRAIQNFVTMTPTVNVTTGDIRNDVDVDMIIARIEDSLEREIANSAQGVFA